MTPRQILMEKYKTQTAIADAAGCTRQAVSIAFSRGRLSFQIASVLSKKMRIPIKHLLTEWVPYTNKRAAQSPHSKRRLNAVNK